MKPNKNANLMLKHRNDLLFYVRSGNPLGCHLIAFLWPKECSLDYFPTLKQLHRIFVQTIQLLTSFYRWTKRIRQNSKLQINEPKWFLRRINEIGERIEQFTWENHFCALNRTHWNHNFKLLSLFLWKPTNDRRTIQIDWMILLFCWVRSTGIND